MRFPFFRNRDSVKNGILISIRRTGDGFHPGLFKKRDFLYYLVLRVFRGADLHIKFTFYEEQKHL